MADSGLEKLASMEYPGRVIIMGRTELDMPYAATILTGRSDSSRNRQYVSDKKNRTVHVRPIDPTKIDPNQAFWIYYPCMATTPDGRIAVSNGLQTELIYSQLTTDSGMTVSQPVLFKALDYHAGGGPQFLRYDSQHGWVDITSHEIDAPNNTSRISGVVIGLDMHMMVARETPKGVKKEFIRVAQFDAPLHRREARMLPTYDGIDTGKEKLHQYTGKPAQLWLNSTTPEEIAKELRKNICPENDNFVALAVQFAAPEIQPHIINARVVA